MSAFSDPRWFDRAAVVVKGDFLCRAVPHADGSLLRAAETAAGGALDLVTLRIVDGPLQGHHAGLLLWPPRSQAVRQRLLGPLADALDRESLTQRFATATVRCQLETSPFGDLEVRKILAIADDHPLPDPQGPEPPVVRADLLPPIPSSQPSQTEVHVLRTVEEVRAAVALLQDAPVLGLDIETACTRLPPEQREDRGAFEPWNGTARLVQIAAPATSGRPTAFVVDCWSVDPGPLLRLLGDGRRVLAHNAKFEQSWIKYRWDVELREVLDTCALWTVIVGHLNAAGYEHGVVDAKLVTLAERFLGTELDKSFQTSDWGQEELSVEQLAYAGEDAAVLLPLATLLEGIAHELGCYEQASVASQAGARRAAITARFGAERNADEQSEALELISSATTSDALDATAAVLRRLVLSAASRSTVGAAYVARRSSLAA